jgi:hypothetical protein
MAVTEINKKGGVLGRSLDLVIADSATDAAVANTDAKRLINDDGVAPLFASDTAPRAKLSYRWSNATVKRRSCMTLSTKGHACDPQMWVMGEVPEQCRSGTAACWLAGASTWPRDHF